MKTYGRRRGGVGFDATRLTSMVSCQGHNSVSVSQRYRSLSSTKSVAQCEATYTKYNLQLLVK